LNFNPGLEMVKQLNKVAPAGKVVSGLAAVLMIAEGAGYAERIRSQKSSEREKNSDSHPIDGVEPARQDC